MNIAVALGGNHARSGTLMLQGGISGDGRAMKNMVDLGQGEPCLGAQFLDPADHAQGWIGRSSRHFMDGELVLVGVCQDNVGVRTTNIRADKDHTVSLML